MTYCNFTENGGAYVLRALRVLDREHSPDDAREAEEETEQDAEACDGEDRGDARVAHLVVPSPIALPQAGAGREGGGGGTARLNGRAERWSQPAELTDPPNSAAERPVEAPPNEAILASSPEEGKEKPQIGSAPHGLEPKW